MLQAAALAALAGGPTVTLTGGVAQGRLFGDVNVFRGIPFAAPPVGDLRWRPPQPAKRWAPATLDATDFRHNCYQAMDMGWPQPLSTQAEDCLYLNVYAPATRPTKPVPVMLWIYGGGFQGGGGNETRLNGTWDVSLQKGELIVVTFNYRNNIFGFFGSDELRSRDPAGGTGNYGILDQRMAMQWVQREIGSFGGDPSRVFIVGQSAGADSVSNHLVRPKSWGLFATAGLESGAFYPGTAEPAVSDKVSAVQYVLRVAKCSDIECLLGLSETDLFKTVVTDMWVPMVDGVDLTARGVELAAKGKLAPVPVLIGSVMEDINKHGTTGAESTEDDFRKWLERAGFNSTEVDAGVAAYSDEEIRPGGEGKTTKWFWAETHGGADDWAGCPARRTARWVAAAGQKAYLYYWRYIPKGYNGRYPQLAHHACEQPFIFHVLSETPEQLAEDHGAYHIDPSEADFSAKLVGYWASFAAGAVPKGDVDWPSYDGNEKTLVFGDDMGIAVEQRVRAAKCDLWDALFQRRLAATSA